MAPRSWFTVLQCSGRQERDNWTERRVRWSMRIECMTLDSPDVPRVRWSMRTECMTLDSPDVPRVMWSMRTECMTCGQSWRATYYTWLQLTAPNLRILYSTIKVCRCGTHVINLLSFLERGKVADLWNQHNFCIWWIIFTTFGISIMPLEAF